MGAQTNTSLSAGASISTTDAPAIPHDAARLDGPLMLRDGMMLYQRAIRADDAQRLQAFHTRLSHQAIVFRFFGVMSTLSSELAGRLSHVDYENRMAVVATPEVGADEPIIAVARYQRTDAEAAEFALAVEDRWQGRGVGPQLLRTLATYACHRGFTMFIAEVMHENTRMLALVRHCGFPATLRLRDGHIEARLDISGLSSQWPIVQDEAPHATKSSDP